MLEDSEVAKMEEQFFELVRMAEKRQAEGELLRSVGRERLVELAQAERDGRLVVLPCKVGDTLYWSDIYMRRQGVREYKVKEIDPTIIFEGHTYIPVSRIGKDYFKTRQEAEAAVDNATKPTKEESQNEEENR